MSVPLRGAVLTQSATLSCQWLVWGGVVWWVDIFRGINKLLFEAISFLVLGYFIAQEYRTYVPNRFFIRKFFYFMFWVQSNFVLCTSFLLEAILHKPRKTSELWNFFVSSVIYFIKYLVLHYSLLWEAPRSAGVTVNKYSPVIIYWEIVTFPLVNKYSLQEISTPLETVWSVVLSHLNIPGSSMFLGNM